MIQIRILLANTGSDSNHRGPYTAFVTGSDSNTQDTLAIQVLDRDNRPVAGKPVEAIEMISTAAAVSPHITSSHHDKA
jgi:hypothetical protein